MIVVAILGLLVTILVPAFLAWQRQACIAKCQSNMKSLLEMTIGHATNNRGRLPEMAAAGKAEDAINPHWINRAWRDQMIDKWGVTREMLYCPSNTAFDRDEHWDFTYEGQPYAMIGYCYFGNNRYLSRAGDRPVALNYLDDQVGDPAFSRRMTQMPSYDVVWADACISRGNDVAWIVANHLDGGQPEGLNQAYLDGSVQWVPREDIREVMTLANGADKATVFFGDITGPGRGLADIELASAGGSSGYGSEIWGQGTPGIPEDWAKSPENPVLTGPVSYGNPCVIFENGVYKMWLCGDTPSRDIFYCTSPDGENWSDPQVVIPRTSWAMRDPCVIKDDDGYKMWYTAHDGSGQPGGTRVEYATSDDGVSWTQHGAVMSSGAAGSPDEYGIHNPEVVKEDGVYKMWYGGTGTGANAPSTISYATSADGVAWNKQQVVMESDGSGFDAAQVFPGGMYKEDDTYYLMYHGYDAANSKVQMGVATSNDGINFTRQDDPLLPTGGPNDFDNGMIGYSVCDGVSVVRVGDEYKMWYGAYANQGQYAGKSSIGLARSQQIIKED